MDARHNLISKGKVWQSDSNDIWIFTSKDLFRIKNHSNNTVLGATFHGKVIKEDIVEDKVEQLWEKNGHYYGGYFTLKNFENSKLMTATSKNGLETKGNQI